MRNHLSWPAKVPQGGAPQQLKQPLVVPFKLLWEPVVGDTFGPGYIHDQKCVRKVECKQPRSVLGFIWSAVCNEFMGIWINIFNQPMNQRDFWCQFEVWTTRLLSTNFRTKSNPLRARCFGTQPDKSYTESSSTYCPACCQKEIILDMVNGTLTAAKAVLCYRILNISSSSPVLACHSSLQKESPSKQWHWRR